MLKCYGYQHNYILIYAVWWLISVRCAWDGLDPSAPMTRWINEVPHYNKKIKKIKKIKNNNNNNIKKINAEYKNIYQQMWSP